MLKGIGTAIFVSAIADATPVTFKIVEKVIWQLQKPKFNCLVVWTKMCYTRFFLSQIITEKLYPG